MLPYTDKKEGQPGVYGECLIVPSMEGLEVPNLEVGFKVYLFMDVLSTYIRQVGWLSGLGSMNSLPTPFIQPSLTQTLPLSVAIWTYISHFRHLFPMSGICRHS